MNSSLKNWCTGLLAGALAAAGQLARAQNTPQSMLDVRLAAQEYRAAEVKGAVEKAGTSSGSAISTDKLTAHTDTIAAAPAFANVASPVESYRTARQNFTDAITPLLNALKATNERNAVQSLQLEWLSKQQLQVECREANAPAVTAPASTVAAWYTAQTAALDALTTALTATPATAPPTNETALKKDIENLDLALKSCKKDEPETVALVRGLGEGLFTGSRLIPAVTVLADVTHFKPSGSAFIGGLELTGLNADALKQIDSSAVRRNLLYPELSTFGAGLTLGICKHSPADTKYERSFIGVLWRGSYLLKNLRDPAATTSDTRQVGTDHLLSTITVEYVVPKLSLAFFVGYSYQEVVGGREAFRRILETDVTAFSYLSWGVRGRLNVGSSKGTKNLQNINVEISFIQLTDRMQRLLQTTDPLIPTIRVGFNHRIFDNL